jgi:hypothetical protein
VRPGFYTQELEFVPPTESDLALAPKVIIGNAEDSITVSAVPSEMEFIPSTESDLAPTLKVSAVKADELEAVSAVTIDYYAYSFLE